MASEKKIITHSPDETIELASRIGPHLECGDLVALVGDLGAGKTMFVKGLAKGLGVDDYLYVNSPSFVVLKEYQGAKRLYHFDVYRLEPQSFSETLDFERYFYDEGITVVEWADKIRELLPEDYLEIKITHTDRTERSFDFRAVGEKYKEVLENL